VQWKTDGKIKQNDLSIEALVLTYLYPRIDVNVSTGINHLLKSPWCVHPKTGKLCVPIDPKRPDDFDCTRVPTLTSVINEIGELSADQRVLEEGDSITPPCLEPFMRIFKEFLERSRKQNIASLKKANKAKAAAAAG